LFDHLVGARQNPLRHREAERGKRLELLREVVPTLRRLPIVANARNPSNLLEMGEARTAAQALGLDIVAWEIRRAGEIQSISDGWGYRS
jgi:ABC-type uncharacterized transport system substrate-binding protein